MTGKPEFLSVLRRVGFSLSNSIFPSLNFKPFQLKCLESILKGQDVIGVLPTGSGKSMLFHGCIETDHLFKVLRKCNSKFDCLVYEMLYIKDIKPSLNTQADSIRAKLFT